MSSTRMPTTPSLSLIFPTKGGFADMAKLKGDKEIGDKFNKIIGKFAEANELKEVLSYLAPVQRVVSPQATDNS